VHIKKFLAVAFICTAVFAVGQAFADDADDVIDDGSEAWINNVPPMSNIGMRGLSQTAAAEPLGMGRLNFLVSGSWFKQGQKLREFYDTVVIIGSKRDTVHRAGPETGSSVSVLRFGGSYGVNDDIDIFAVMPFYFADGITWPGLFMGGGQYTFPFPPEMSFRLALHAFVIYGLRKPNDPGIDPYRITYNPGFITESDKNPDLTYAGYDFNDVREDSRISLTLKVPMSIVNGNLRRAFKIHLNPGVELVQQSKTFLLLTGGFEINTAEYLTFGVEGNYRRPFSSDHDFMADPMWVTPTVSYRSPYYSDGLFGWSVVAGADISLSSKTKDTKVNGLIPGEFSPLETYRLFGGVAFSFDLLASKRAEMIRKARASAAEKARLRKLAALTEAQRDSVAQKARQDSLELAAALVAKAEKARQDSISMAEKARQDSIAMAEGSAEREARLKAEAEAREAHLTAESERKRAADSVALAELNKRLAEEKAKRSAAEQQMLSTGMLVLDGVFFVTGKAEIQLNSRGYLTTLAKMLVKYPKLRLEIGGHTDNTGRLETNMALSQSRADAVFMFMHNIEPGLAQMLTAKGYGPTVPKADNNTAAGREVNRRVEIKVLNPEVLKDYNP